MAISKPQKRPQGATTLPTSTASLAQRVEPTDIDDHNTLTSTDDALFDPLRPTAISTGTSTRSRRASPSSPPVPSTSLNPATAALTSALRPAADSLSARGGNMHNAQAWLSTAPPSALGLTNLVALDLQVPQPPVSVTVEPTTENGHARHRASHPTHKASQQRADVDHGYEGETQQSRDRREDNHHLVVPRSYGPRDYLTGPADELVERLPRPSPLSRSASALPSPALSSTSVSTPGATLPDQDISSDLFRRAVDQRLNAAAAPGGGRRTLGLEADYDDEADYCADEAQTLLAEDSTPSRPRPRAFTLSHSAFGSFGTFPSTARSGPLAAPTLRSRFKLFWLQLFANAASAAFLILIVIWALSARFFQASYRQLRGLTTPRHRREWDTDEARAYRKTEKVVKDIQYYARRCGFDVIEQTVETKDGYLLKVFKVECLRKPAKVHSDGRKGFPVLIQHGLFQSCGSL